MEAAHVSANFFDALGIKPALGRSFDPATRQGPESVVLSNQVWRRLGSDPGILGKPLRIAGRPYVVLGVMPPITVGGAFIGLGDLWIWSSTDRTPEDNKPGSYRGRYVIGRLKLNVSAEQARSELSSIEKQLETELPQFYRNVTVTVKPLREVVVGGVRPALTILFASVAFLLLIACANVANLLLGSSVARRKEVAIRLALGARRAQIVRQFLTESLVLSVIGGILGIGAAKLGLAIFVRLAGHSLPRAEAVSIDMRVLLFSVGVALATGILSGIAPALAAALGDLNTATREGVRGMSSGPGSRRLRRLLVSAEVALSIVLLAGSGLLLRSFWKLAEVDLGFRPACVLTAELRILDLAYLEKGGVRSELLKRLMSRLQALPGVTHAGASYYFPLREKQVTHYATIMENSS